MAGVRTGERKLKFDTSARYKQIASYALTVNTPTNFLPKRLIIKLPANQAAND